MPEEGHKLSAEPYRRGPIDCLQRGLRSLRANWQLVPLLLTQTLLTLGLALAGFFILLAALGVSVVTWVRDLGPSWPQEVAEDLVTSLEMGPPALLPLVAPLIVASLVWTVAFCLYCYLQGGVVGVLAEAEMAAGAGLPGWRAFRAFSGTGFDLQGRRLFWRYFWLNHLYAAAALVWMSLLLGLMALSVSLATGPNNTAGVAIGCVGLVLLGLLLLAIALWAMLATVEVARPGAGVWAASRRALGAMRRRFVPVLVIYLLAAAGVMIISAAFVPLELGVTMAAGDRISVWLGGRGVLMLAKSLAGHALVVALIASLAALVELRRAGEAEAA